MVQNQEPLPEPPVEPVSPAPLAPNDYNNQTNNPNTVCGAQWLLLWTTAAYSPESPSVEERTALQKFFTNFLDQCEDRSYRKTLDTFGAPSCRNMGIVVEGEGDGAMSCRDSCENLQDEDKMLSVSVVVPGREEMGRRRMLGSGPRRGNGTSYDAL